MADVVTAAWLGVLVGALLATFWPYYNAWKRSGGGTKFDLTYAISLAVSVLIAMPTSLAAYAIVAGAVPASLAEYADSAWFLFAVGVFVGSGINRLWNEKIVDKARA